MTLTITLIVTVTLTLTLTPTPTLTLTLTASYLDDTQLQRALHNHKTLGPTCVRVRARVRGSPLRVVQVVFR